jgi:hypothetical protein
MISSFYAGGPGNQNRTVEQLSFCLAPVLAIEPLDAARRVDELLFACEKRVAVRANLKSDFGLGRARLPRLAASAMNCRVHILWMNIRLHFLTRSCYEFGCQRNT